jgi:hypothetical protein
VTQPQQVPKALRGRRRAPGRVARPAGGGRAVVAVLGSVAALGGSAGSASAATTPTRAARPTAAARTARRADPLPAGEIALLGLVFAGLAAGAPAIARPLLDRGIAERLITPGDADAFLARLADVDVGGGAGAAVGGAGTAVGGAVAAVGGTGGVGADSSTRAGVRSTVGHQAQSPAALALFQDVFDAIRRQLPMVAKPLVLDAVATGEISQAQARRIEQRLLVRAHLGSAGLHARHDGHGSTKTHTEPLFTGRLP